MPSVIVQRLPDARVQGVRRVQDDPPPYLKLRTKLPGGGQLLYTATVHGAIEVIVEKTGLDQVWVVGTRWELWTKVPALLGEGTLGGIHEYDKPSLPVNGVWLEFLVEASYQP